MTKAEFCDRLAALKLNETQFAARTGVSAETVRRWGKTRGYPRWVGVLLNAWEEVS